MHIFFYEGSFDPLNRQTEDGLPVFYIQPVPVSSEYSPVTIYYRGEEYQAKAKTRGASSREFPMKSYTIQFSENQLFHDPEFEFTNKNKIVLITSFNDNSCLRHRLAFDLWNRMDEDHIQVRTYNAVVYLNSKYWGLYTVADHIDGNLMAEQGIDQYGDLYQGETQDADFYLKENLHQGFRKLEGYPEHGDQNAYTVLDNFVEFIAGTESDDFLARLDSVLNKKEYEDWWISVTFMQASDTIGKNAFHYYDSANRIWRFIPWDFNDSFGQNWKTKRTSPLSIYDYRDFNNIFNRFIEQEEIYNPLKSRYYDILLTGNAFDISWILAKIDDYYQEIRTAASKSEKKWKDKYMKYKLWIDREDFTTFEEEILYIKDWINKRHTRLLEKFD